MKPLHLRFEVGERTVIRDHVMGLCQSGLSRCLYGYDRVRLLPIFRVSLQQSLNLSFLRHIDHQDAIDIVFESAFHEQRNDQDLVRAAGSRRKPLQLTQDDRMQNGLELLAPGGIVEYQLAQAATIKCSVGAEDASAKRVGNCLEGRLARGDDSMRDFVGVDHGYATRGKKTGNRAFAAGYAPSKADA